MKNENYKDFTTKYEDFIYQEGSETYERIQEWFYTVQKRHKIIRKKLGGISSTQTVQVKDEGKPSVEYSAINWMVHDILYYMPNFFTDSKLDKECFCCPILPDGQRLTKILLDYSRGKKLGQYANDNIERYVSRLNEIWNKGVVRSGKYYCHITTAGMGFAKLGHYGVDEDSCFSEHGSNFDHKYNLGKSSNTFVCLVSQTKFDKDGSSENIIGRCWGFLSGKTGKVINLSNFYFDCDYNKRSIAAVVKKSFEQICGTELNEFKDFVSVDSNIYQNGNDNFSFTTAKEVKTTQKLNSGRFLYPKGKKPTPKKKQVYVYLR